MQSEVPFSQAIKKKYPEQIVVAIARDSRGKCNPITIGWTMICSSQPPMMAIAVGTGKHSAGAIEHAGQFVIAFPAAGQGDEVMVFGTKSGADTDKLALAGSKTSPASCIDSVLLSDAVANFECELVSQTETGDHVIYVGKVLAAHTNAGEKPLDRLYTVGPGWLLGGLGRQDGQ